jgi:hypothetical protein
MREGLNANALAWPAPVIVVQVASASTARHRRCVLHPSGIFIRIEARPEA